jgi:hypothetical protein
MAAESEQPGAGEPAAAAGESAEHAGQDASRERFGPLSLLRTQKADGRALLLFSRRDDERP